MKKLMIACAILALPFTGAAQQTCTIKRAFAWFSSAMPGAQRVDENGNPVDPKPIITRFIYAEYSGTKAPDIKSVTYNGAELQFTVVKLSDKTVWAGDKQFNPKNSMTVKKGNAVLKIELQPLEGREMPDGGCKNIIVKSKAGNKLCRFYVPAEKQFETLPMY